MKLKISKNVSRNVESEIQFAFEFAARRAKRLGKNISKTTIEVTRGASGACFRGYWGRAFQRQGRILMRFADKLPPHRHEYARFQNMPTFEMAGGSESVVYLAAHELGHILGWGGDKIGEIACCKFGYEAVMEWRDQQYNSPACLI